MRDPDQGLSPCPLQWNRGVLATGLPGKSFSPLVFLFVSFLTIFVLFTLFLNNPLKMFTLPRPVSCLLILSSAFPHFLFSFLITKFIYLFIYFWLRWVFVAGLSLVAAREGYSSWRWLLLWNTGSRRVWAQ